MAGERIVGAKTVGAHRLDAVGDALHGHVGRELLGMSGRQHGVGALVDQAGGAIAEQARSLEIGRGIDQLPAHALMLDHRLAEGLALLRVAHRRFQRGLQHAAAHGRDIGAGAVDAGQRRLEGLARRMQHRLVGRKIVDQPEAADADRVATMQLERLLAMEARPLGLDGEADDAAIALRPVGLRIGHRKTRDGGIGDPGLGAVDLPAALDAHGLHLQSAEVTADTGFAETGAADQLTGQHARQQPFDLGRLAISGEARAGIVMIDQREREGEVVPRDLLEGAQLAGEGEPLPAMLLRQFDRVEAEGAGRLDGLERIAALPFPAGGVGRDLFFGERLGARHDGALFGSEDFIEHMPEIHDWTSGATAG